MIQIEPLSTSIPGFGFCQYIFPSPSNLNFNPDSSNLLKAFLILKPLISGTRVFLENLDNGEKINYKIVGKDEADLKQKLIYYQSPIGKGLIGKNKDDLVEINTPAGKKNFEIKNVEYI